MVKSCTLVARMWHEGSQILRPRGIRISARHHLEGGHDVLFDAISQLSKPWSFAWSDPSRQWWMNDWVDRSTSVLERTVLKVIAGRFRRTPQ
jgi:hypothetical protein